MSRSIPPRLHVLLAREASVGVVFRRGPSKTVCSVGWDRATDQFQIGQWLRGRIYERRADLSPDGRHLIYFAMNGKWSSEAKGSWTAISRAPWLKALVLYAKGDCWNGGGLFTGPSRYWLNDGCADAPIRDSAEVHRDTQTPPPPRFGNECTGLYYPRLLRDGWSLIAKRGVQHPSATIFERPLTHGWVLRKLAHEEINAPIGRACYWDEHLLVRPDSDDPLAKPDWEWAERDGDQLLWASAGCLYRAPIDADHGVGTARLLHDFNGMTFEPIAAPY